MKRASRHRQSPFHFLDSSVVSSQSISESGHPVELVLFSVEESAVSIWLRMPSLSQSYLVAAVILQSLWSLTLAMVDIYALLVKRCLRNSRIVSLFTIGDGITSTLTFAAACASAGITVLIGNDLGECAQNHCTKFETATAMAFISWFAVSPSFLLNFWSLASR